MIFPQVFHPRSALALFVIVIVTLLVVLLTPAG